MTLMDIFKQFGSLTANRRLFSAADLFRLIIPLFVEQLLAVTIGLADTVMVSSTGEAAVSGISNVDQLNILLIQIFTALATGGAVISAQYLGRGDKINANRSAKQLIIISAVVSCVVAAISICFNRSLLGAIYGRVEQNVMDNSVIYFYLTAASYPFLALFSACSALFRSMNSSRVCMFVSLIMNVVNITGNALLIYVFKMGVAGAGASTLASRIIGAVIMMIIISRPGHVITVSKLWHPELNFKMIASILKIGVPTGLENGIFQIGKLLVQTLITSFGTSAIAANAVSNSIAGFACIPGNAVGLALITVVGRCIGAGEKKQARDYSLLMMEITYAAMITMSVAAYLLTSLMVSGFNVSAEASEQAVRILHTYFIFSALIWPAAFTLPNALRAAGDARFTMWVSMFSMWIFRIGFSYILADRLQMAVYGVWIAMIIDWFARAACFSIRFLRGKWLNIKVI